MRGSPPTSGCWGVKHQIEALQKRWQDEGRFRGLHAGMSLEREGVMLGARTVLAKRCGDGSLESEDARVLTLLSVAYGTPVGPSVVGTIRRASKHAQAGDECMASMHIALARLPRLPDPSDAAQRLFIADGLMEEGVSPRDIWAALEFDPAPLDALEKEFNPSEARVPAGSGRPSGEWTAGETGSEIIDATVSTIAEWAPFIARYGSGPAAFLSALLYSTPAGGRKHEGIVPGRPDLRYSWNGDETELDIQEVSDGKVVMRAALGPDGKFRNGSNAVARETRSGVLFDPEELPSGQPRSWPPANDNEDPKVCPEPPVPDKPGLAGPGGDNARAYEMFVRMKINPSQPTPQGLTYVLLNPDKPGWAVFFDECQKKPGAYNEDGTFNVPGSIIDAKFGYGAKVDEKRRFGLAIRESLTKKWFVQGMRQIRAARGRQVIWYFSDQSALDFARQLFAENKDLARIRLEYLPMPKGWTWR
jgi:hypothetical protein